MSEEMKTQSLDDTLKELLEESSTPEATETPKPKRTRRTKAQIEADKKAAEAEIPESKVAETDSSENTIPADNIPTPICDVAEDPVPVLDKESLIGEPLKVSVEPSEEFKSDEILAPEVVLDTSEDELPDVTESVEDEVKAGPEKEEQLEPEIVEDTPMDALPDVEEPKKQPPQKKVYPSGETIEALNGTSNKKTSKYIGKSIILKDLTPMFRAPHYSMRIKPYRGLVTVIEDPKGNFVKVQYLRQGFGMCSSYMESYHLINNLEGSDSNVSEEDCPC